MLTLRPRHQRFVDEFAKDFNATAAYRRAGYRARGHAAEVNASRLRKRSDVRAACAAALEADLRRINAEREAAAQKPIRLRGIGFLMPDGSIVTKC